MLSWDCFGKVYQILKKVHPRYFKKVYPRDQCLCLDLIWEFTQKHIHSTKSPYHFPQRKHQEDVIIFPTRKIPKWWSKTRWTRVKKSWTALPRNTLLCLRSEKKWVLGGLSSLKDQVVVSMKSPPASWIIWIIIKKESWKSNNSFGGIPVSGSPSLVLGFFQTWKCRCISNSTFQARPKFLALLCWTHRF